MTVFPVGDMNLNPTMSEVVLVVLEMSLLDLKDGHSTSFWETGVGPVVENDLDTSRVHKSFRPLHGATAEWDFVDVLQDFMEILGCGWDLNMNVNA
jgi:hypothetical protein